MKNELPRKRIAELIGASSISDVEPVQTLWSGYGQIVRARLANDCIDSAPDGMPESVIVKHVCPPSAPQHKYGWASDVSHQRKLRSYEVELTWYRDFAGRCDDGCRVAKLVGGERLSSDDGRPGWLIVLEDLDASGFPIRPPSVNDSQIRTCLEWLAAFHATFLTDTADSSKAMRNVGGLWPVGTYWHLETRPDELAAMEDGSLRRAAAAIDRRLSKARFQTLVHGDAKLANFCFAAGDSVAAVDFQYVGGGCGMKDVAYFFSSCLSDEQCRRREQELLGWYFDALKDRARFTTSFAALESEWRSLYEFAWADFYRFLAGWSPGHWKIHGYSHEVTQRVLRRLDRIPP